MWTWRLRETGRRRPPPEGRIAAAIVVLGLWVVAGVFLTFGAEYQINNVWARMGLYGRPIPGAVYGVAQADRYPKDTVDHVNHLAEVVGNWLLFVPLVVALVLLWPRIRLWQVAAVAALLSTGVEVGQRVAGGRVPEVVDVVVNTAGAVLAYLVIAAARLAWRRVRGRPEPQDGPPAPATTTAP